MSRAHLGQFTSHASSHAMTPRQRLTSAKMMCAAAERAVAAAALLQHTMSSSSSSDDDDTVSSTGRYQDAAAIRRQQDEARNDENDASIAKDETRDVARLRLVVAIVLIGSAIGVALGAHFYIKGSEHNQFVEQFRDDSEKVLHAIGSSLDQTLGLLDGVAVQLVSHARFANQTWPMVTLPNFAVRMSKIVQFLHAVNINILPVVTSETRSKWETYAANNNDWLNETLNVQDNWNGYHGPITYNGNHSNTIHGDFGDIPLDTSRDMLPLWQNFPVIANTTFTYGYDWLSTSVAGTYEACLTQHKALISKPYMVPDPRDAVQIAEAQAWADYYSAFISPDEEANEPMSDFVYPIVDEIDRVVVAGADDYVAQRHTVVGMIGASFQWRSMLHNILPTRSNGIQVVFANPCTQAFSYQIDGPNVVYLGVNDQHEADYANMVKSRRLDSLVGQRSGRSDSAYTGAPLNTEHCPITLHIYPSSTMKARYTSHDSTVFTLAVVAIFALTSLVFYCFNAKVERRQAKVLKTATETSAIVSSLFPSKVRDRLRSFAVKKDDSESQHHHHVDETVNGRFRRMVRSSIVVPVAAAASTTSAVTSDSSPIADLYPDTTVLFADIVGFTAWSSVRTPTQVFCLLETIYAAFDEIAKKRGVFKVETIGDSYVAVVGLPTPHKQHAVLMARFANDCRSRFQVVTRELDEVLGPGTADLSMRFGLNSGPTTGGVLRGEKSRFQLFGDTVNTAARMESNGKPGEIQVSQKTADLIIIAGKGHWLTRREEHVECKGKGMMTTYWCSPRGSGSLQTSERSSTDFTECETTALPSEAPNALITWNYNLFMGLLDDVVAQRPRNPKSIDDDKILEIAIGRGGTPLAEVKEVVDLPLSTVPPSNHRGSSPAKISLAASDELNEVIATVAGLYRSNPFHNFEHCCHVVMSTKKLLDRMSNLENNQDTVNETSRCCYSSDGVARNPLSRLAIVFAALIHDVDHPGVSNAQLVQEGHDMAVSYNGKSVAEQNSVDVAWRILIQPQFASLRSCMFATDDDVHQFRAILVNAVLATDLFDSNLKSMRDARWQKSFNGDMDSTVATWSIHGSDETNRRATIVMDLIIQASDVSHTMQHFTVYKKWNLRLLAEMHDAYACGRTTKDPLDGWYEGELWFFDNYIIPLAQKLRECGVFGVSCDEFLDYARDNRMEWEVKGREIVREAADSLRRREVASDDQASSSGA